MRLFCAIGLDSAVKAYISDIIKGLNPEARFSATREDNLHITLKFLGQTAPYRLQSIYNAMDNAVSAVNAFRIKTGAIDAFKSGEGKTLYLSIKKDDRLLYLYRRLEDELYHAGFEREKRAYKGHITLARRFMGEVENIGVKAVEIPVNAITLYESTRENGILIYRELYSCFLN